MPISHINSEKAVDSGIEGLSDKVYGPHGFVNPLVVPALVSSGLEYVLNDRDPEEVLKEILRSGAEKALQYTPRTKAELDQLENEYKIDTLKAIKKNFTDDDSGQNPITCYFSSMAGWFLLSMAARYGFNAFKFNLQKYIGTVTRETVNIVTNKVLKGLGTGRFGGALVGETPGLPLILALQDQTLGRWSELFYAVGGEIRIGWTFTEDALPKLDFVDQSGAVVNIENLPTQIPLQDLDDEIINLITRSKNLSRYIEGPNLNVPWRETREELVSMGARAWSESIKEIEAKSLKAAVTSDFTQRLTNVARFIEPATTTQARMRMNFNTTLGLIIDANKFDFPGISGIDNIDDAIKFIAEFNDLAKDKLYSTVFDDEILNLIAAKVSKKVLDLAPQGKTLTDAEIVVLTKEILDNVPLDVKATAAAKEMFRKFKRTSGIGNFTRIDSLEPWKGIIAAHTKSQVLKANLLVIFNQIDQCFIMEKNLSNRLASRSGSFSNLSRERNFEDFINSQTNPNLRGQAERLVQRYTNFSKEVQFNAESDFFKKQADKLNRKPRFKMDENTNKGAIIMSKKDIRLLVSEVLNEGYGKYPYHANEPSESEPDEDYMVEWKALVDEVCNNKKKNVDGDPNTFDDATIEVAKILVKDQDLFRDVLEMAGSNKSIGVEIMQQLKSARQKKNLDKELNV